MEKERQEILYWNKAASAYCVRQDDLKSIYQPVVEEQLGDVSGKRILDAGCGDGSYSKSLASRGAIVIGIDGSSEMISIAKRRSKNTKVKYRLADLTAKLPFSNDSFDVVLANMVLMDIPKIDLAISEFARLLSANGFLVLSIPHPCFFCSDWIKDEKSNHLHKEIADYLTPKVEELTFWGKRSIFTAPFFITSMC